MFHWQYIVVNHFLSPHPFIMTLLTNHMRCIQVIFQQGKPATHFRLLIFLLFSQY